MSRADDVLAECAANPDDDEPRLVWADLVGGERGELVVLQCDLARGNVTPERRARERELLDRCGVEWAGSLARTAWRWSFRRGFIEAASLRNATLRRDEHPLLTSITSSDRVDVDGVRALGIRNGLRPELGLERFTRLTGLGLEGVTDASYEHARTLVARNPIEHLRLQENVLPADRVVEILRAALHVTALELSGTVHATAAEAVFAMPLRALRLGRVHYAELALLEGSVAAQTLERLSFDLLGEAPLLDDVLAACPNLRLVERRGEFGGSDELVHHSADAMLSLGLPCFERSLPACIVRVDIGEIIEIPSHAADTTLYVGRSRDTLVRVASGTVARRHAALAWRDGAHELTDLGSTNGVVIDQRRVDRTMLRDGDVVVLGSVTLRYFVGDGCRARAEAAVSGSSTR